jgi:hypothetical protein
MSFLVKPPFHYNLASAFVDDIQLGRSNYYYYLGKTLPWGTSDSPPDSIVNTSESETEIRNEIVAMEKISASDVSLVIARNDWTSGQIYDMWDSTVDMTSKKFFVLTEEYNVYKCISNNEGVPSTVKPFGTSISMVTTSDGYIWKYMYTVPLSKRNKFTSSAYIPVQRSMADSFYDAGAVTDVLIGSQGTGYTDNLRVALTLTGGNPTTPAVLIPVVSNTDGSIQSVIIQNAGIGYTSAPTISVVSDNGTGSGLWNSQAVIKPIIQGGKIVRVTIEDAGHNYPHGISTYIDVNGDGVGASFTPIVRDGKVVAVTIDNRGSGYTFMTLQVMGTGSGATLTPFIGSNDLTTEQSLVESTAIDGGIHWIRVTVPGNSYTTASVVIDGDGTGATATATIQGGQITKIAVVNPGSGYTHCTVKIIGNNLTNNPAAVSAVAIPIMTPFGGHGKDAPRELFADTVCMYSLVRYTTTSATQISQDFRQYGIIKNPSKAYTGASLVETFALTTYTVTLSGSFGISKDDVVHNGDKKYRVIDLFAGNVAVLLPINCRNLLVGESLTTENNVNTYTVNSISAIPLANKYSGEMLFISADYSFAFNTQQSVTIKTYLKL